MHKMKKIDLGCGYNKRQGFIGVDATPKEGVDIVHDLNIFPYPFKDECADYIEASHILEHIVDWRSFIGECCRILSLDGILHIKVPHCSGSAAWGNPEHIRAFGLRWFGCLCDDIHIKESYPLKVLDINLHYRESNYRGGVDCRRLHERLLDGLAGFNPRLCEDFWSYYVGGFREIEVYMRKK